MTEQPDSILQKLVLESIKEQRLRRRWGIFFKLAFLSLCLSILSTVFWTAHGNHYINISNKPHTALINIDGVIKSGSDVDADIVVAGLRHAFADKGTKGIVMRINSPGGSAVQASYIYDEINRLKRLYPTTKVYAVCAENCASSAYYVATAADKIYADPASMVGSIGVVTGIGFGFVDAMQKLGISRRLFTAGEHKGFLDPFSPLKPDEVAHIQRSLNNVHQQFINKVKQGRGSRLHLNNDTFSGWEWTGEEAQKMGLVDDFGSTGYVAREVIKAADIVDYTVVRANYLKRFADRIGVSASSALVKSLSLEQNITLQ